MPRKTLYNKDYSYNNMGNKISEEVNEVLKPIFEKYANKDINIRELSHLIKTEVSMIETEFILNKKEDFS